MRGERKGLRETNSEREKRDTVRRNNERREKRGKRKKQ